MSEQGLTTKSVREDKEYLKSFKLIYIRKSDGVRFLVKRVTALDCVIIDTTTGIITQITRSRLRRDFYPDKELNKKNHEPQRPKLKRWN